MNTLIKYYRESIRNRGVFRSLFRFLLCKGFRFNPIYGIIIAMENDNIHYMLCFGGEKLEAKRKPGRPFGTLKYDNLEDLENGIDKILR